jgi:hypothetical protein
MYSSMWFGVLVKKWLRFMLGKAARDQKFEWGAGHTEIQTQAA